MTGPAFDRIRDALEDHGSRTKTESHGLMAQCPAHQDGRPSLSVRALTGRVKLHCFAGCVDVDILDRLGLKVADMFDEPRGVDYQYADGRTVHRSPDKRFTQSGHTAMTSTVLYRLEDVHAAVKAGEPVYLVEGEQDADTAALMGVCGTTAPGGALNFNRVDVAPLLGAHVIAVPDSDAPGVKWLEQVRTKLTEVGARIEVRNVATGKDLTDHYAAGHDLDDLDDVTPGPGASTAPGPTSGGKRIMTRKASGYETRPIIWLWDGLVPMGALSVFAGREGIGKSTALYWAAARLTRGELPGEHYGTPRDVLICATEDGWSDTIKPRLMANGADLDRVYSLDVDNGSITFPGDIGLLTEHIAATRPAAVIFDPLMSRLSGGIDTHKDADVRIALEPLKAMAEQCDIAVMGLMHVNKSTSGDATNRLMGSRAFAAVPRSVVMFAKDKNEDFVRMGCTKANLTATSAGTKRFRIASTTVDRVMYEGTMRDVTASRVDWLDDDAVSIDDAMEASGENGVTRNATDDAAAWLFGYLTDRSGEATKEDVLKAARPEGHLIDALNRARHRIGVLSTNTRTVPRKSLWSLPADASHAPVMRHSLEPHNRTTARLETTETHHNNNNTTSRAAERLCGAGNDPHNWAAGRTTGPMPSPRPAPVAETDCLRCSWPIDSNGHEAACHV